MNIAILIFFCVAAASAAPSSGLGSMIAKGEVSLPALKKFSYVSDKVLARDKTFTVYAGFRDPVFQVVLWGPPEKPARVLIDLDPKKQTMELLNEFNSDWNAHFPEAKQEHATYDDFSKENAEHLKAYCGKLPAGSRCEPVRWHISGVGKVVRMDIHLPVGPPVPKAIEFERGK